MSTAAGASQLGGKVTLITGGAGNIGEVITRRFLDAGATVVITGRNSAKLEAYRARLLAEAAIPAERLLTVVMDGSDMVQVRAGVQQIVDRFGRIDVLVNNAGSAGARQRLPDIPLSSAELSGDSETLLDGIGNLIGISWNLTRAVATHMPPGGSIVNISTIFSRTDYYGRIPYVVPKAALNALSMALAEELGAQGIRVNLIYPGPIDSERIRTVFQRMDELKGQPTGSTAEGFFQTMRLNRLNTAGDLVKGFPQTNDVAGAALFFASDDAAALSGAALEVTNGMDVPLESSTILSERPGLRAVDGSGRVVLICAGDQVEDAMALTGVLRACGSEVVIGFRSRDAVAQLEQILAESRRFGGANYTPPIVLHLDPLEPDSVSAGLNWMRENTGGPNAAIVLPARNTAPEAAPAVADDATVAAFLAEELGGAVAIAKLLARYWETTAIAADAQMPRPRVIFLSNGDDRRGNRYADLLRAGVEQLIRVWRHEAALDYAQAVARSDATRPLAPVWSNQIVRYVNHQEEGLEFACAWAARLLLSDRQVDEINLYLPRDISATTGVQRPSFGWAENLIGLHLGKVALITGGSAGIGGQIGRLLALSGARVMLAARDRHKLEQLQKSILGELHEVGYVDAEQRVQIFPDCDVANEEQLAALVERTLQIFGRVDYLLNNAGIAGVEEMVIDLPLDGWRNTLNANLISNYSLIRKLAPLMQAQGSGYVLNVSSYFGGEKYAAIPYPNRADYAVSKAGQRALAEALARFLGPEVQINALAPGPVEGDRLRGTGERPGLFMRRARLILANKRLNDVHAALIEAHRASNRPVNDLLQAVLANDAQALAADTALPEALRNLGTAIAREDVPNAAGGRFIMNADIATKLIARLTTGGYLGTQSDRLSLASQPPEPFFAITAVEREARKVRDGIMSMLYLQRMPTEFDVAMATVYYLADRNVTGETFHPSGGLRYDRAPTGGELFGQPPAERLAQLIGATVYLIGESLAEQLETLARAFLERYGVGQVVMITETDAGAAEINQRLGDHVAASRLHSIVAGDDIEGALDRAITTYGRPGPVVCTPFRALPALPLAGREAGNWSTVLSEEGFTAICEQQLTHHFRVTHKLASMDGTAIALVTPETTATSSTEQFALANFVKTTLHAFTATVGVECDRTVHRALVNQVDLTRRARAEEPRSETERRQELDRLVDAVLLATAPLPPADDSRYAGRIHRGRAITV
jgi:malonyl-CoA reductase / 3-hydroxypropionate dehydrogenase (NADP+)